MCCWLEIQLHLKSYTCNTCLGLLVLSAYISQIFPFKGTLSSPLHLGHVTKSGVGVENNCLPPTCSIYIYIYMRFENNSPIGALLKLPFPEVLREILLFRPGTFWDSVGFDIFRIFSKKRLSTSTGKV